MPQGYPASAGGIQASSGGLVEDDGREFFDSFDVDRMSAYYERATAGDVDIVRGAGYHTGYGLSSDGLNYMWTVPGSGFEFYPDTGEWVVFVFTIDGWSGTDQLWLPVFGDPTNEAHRGPAYEIQFNHSVQDYRIQSRDGSDNRLDVATDDESDQSFPWLQAGTAYAAGIYRRSAAEGGGVRGGLWLADDGYPEEAEALAIIDSDDHPFDDGSGINGLGPDDGPGRWGLRTGSNMSLRLHEVERAAEDQS